MFVDAGRWAGGLTLRLKYYFAIDDNIFDAIGTPSTTKIMCKSEKEKQMFLCFKRKLVFKINKKRQIFEQRNKYII